MTLKVYTQESATSFLFEKYKLYLLLFGRPELGELKGKF